ncbi:MAG: hypothetical protein KAT46_01160 [Deltaproteobacteria bacterium]|nr:hypothetical protein [Deltaproteobacteria bacterium]
MEKIIKESAMLRRLNKVYEALDHLILYAVATAIVGVALMLLFEAGTDFLNHDQHSVSHIISDLLFVLIIMELFRQVFRQINRLPFSLNPFFYIGIIVSIRGILVLQMKVGLGEAGWDEALNLLLVNAVLVLVFVVSLYVYSKRGRDNHDEG